ncbi:diguanylate cyclase [Roseateles violae]|uniref:Diguanylate cyclase n=1 Tax=Roseateles violae TaxID=3058042 RepID=A0ABT8DVM4_9BURK|nr:diguanylate cyclase [Pelomonas sp. PFR6]MDN3922355.1 diguanylate cyclase [Pelomonas sp. PFR6]
MDDPTRQLLQNTLLYVLLPVWMAAGFGDWLCHRMLKMERTAGLKEALLHLLMLAELGPCLLLALLAEVNALVLSLLALGSLLHELTLWSDLLYAIRRRAIPVVEQWLHSFQIAAPWVALAALALLHWEQALAIVGLGSEPADWSLAWKREPLPAATLSVLLLAGTLLVVLPFLEEAFRCARDPHGEPVGFGAATGTVEEQRQH